MKETPTDKMKKLIKFLPTKDIPIAEKLLKEREFFSLKELVDSAIERVKRNLTKESPNPDYTDIDTDELETLSNIIARYLMLLGYSSSEIYEEDGDEEFLNSDFDEIEDYL